MSAQKVFKTGFKKFFLVSIPALVMAAVLTLLGMRYYETMKHDEAMWFFYVIPWTMAGLILLVLLVIFVVNVRKSIVITPESFSFVIGGGGFKASWKNLTYTAPPPDKKFFRSALVGDGEHYERIESFFFPDFETILEVLRLAKKQARDKLTAIDIDT